MLFESTLEHFRAHLTDLGWFDENRRHAPIRLIDAFPGEDEEVPLNTLAMSYGDSHQTLLEMGSNAENHMVAVYADFYGESASVTRHILGDLYSYVNQVPRIPVYDYSQEPAVLDFYALVVEESVEKTYPANKTTPWQKYWGILSLALEDDRHNG